MPILINNPDLIYTTQDIPHEDKFEFWHDVVCKQYVNLDCVIKDRKAKGVIVSNNIDKINISEAHSVAQLLTRKKQHIGKDLDDQYIFNIQTQGKGRFIQNGVYCDLEQGDCILNDSSCPFTWHFQSNFSHIILQIPRVLLEKALPHAHKYSGLKISNNSIPAKIIKIFVHTFQNEYKRNEISNLDRDFFEAQIVDLISASLILCHEKKSTNFSESKKLHLKCSLKVFINEHLFDENLSIDFIAKKHALSKRSIHKFFEKHEISITEYIITRRLEEAEKILAESIFFSNNITSLGLYVGFKSSSHFSTSFKKKYGMSPREYMMNL